MRFPVPGNLAEAVAREGRRSWVDALPTIVKTLEERWTLEVGRPFEPGGQTAWVAPVRSAAGDDLVLKLAWAHTEAADEAAGLEAWGGHGVVRLHATAEIDDTRALLLERCVPGTALARRPEPEQDAVLAGLLRRVWRAPTSGHRFRSLQVMCDAWAGEYERRAGAMPAVLDPGIARAGIELFRALPATASDTVLLCTDLHAGNVLAARREPWLVIDPKPYVGDPTYDALQHLLNCEERLRVDPHRLAGRVADLFGLDPERLLLWLFARCVQESLDRPSLAEIAMRLAPR